MTLARGGQVNYDDRYDDCRTCGVRDYGWEMSDVRTSLSIPSCTEDCEEGDCDCDSIPVKVTIRRVWDQDCTSCGSVTYRCVYDLTLDGALVKTFDSEHEADDYAALVFPSAKAPEPDYDWESERGLRQAEGWGY